MLLPNSGEGVGEGYIKVTLCLFHVYSVYILSLRSLKTVNGDLMKRFTVGLEGKEAFQLDYLKEDFSF